MPKQPKSNSILYVKLASLNDLARHACNYDYTASSIICVKKPQGYMLMTFGEQIDGATIAYYVNVPQSEKLISYTYPSSNSQGENTHFVKEMGAHPDHFINIIGMDGRNMKEAKKPKPMLAVKVSSPEELVMAVIKRGVEHDSLPHIYSFTNGKSSIICAFDIVEELAEGPKTIYYAAMQKNQSAAFARYKYTENKVDFTTYMGEHSYMYAKIINLAEPFQFFKMPE